MGDILLGAQSLLSASGGGLRMLGCGMVNVSDGSTTRSFTAPSEGKTVLAIVAVPYYVGNTNSGIAYAKTNLYFMKFGDTTGSKQIYSHDNSSSWFHNELTISVNRSNIVFTMTENYSSAGDSINYLILEVSE